MPPPPNPPDLESAPHPPELDEQTQTELKKHDAAVVRLVYFSQFAVTMLYGLLLGSLFDSYLYEIASATSHSDKPNTFVGVVESTRGIATLIVAFPAGWVVDK